MKPPVTTVWGCESCGYALSPSTLPTNYRECPVCRGRWVANPTPRPRPDIVTKPAKARK